MFAWWGQRAKICWTSSLHAHVCLALSLCWRVLPCSNILLGAGLDAGSSAVRLSCIALPTLSCHVTVFAPHLPLPVSVTPPLSLSPRQQGLQLYTVITLSFCRSSALVASRRASRRHRSCILHARLEKYCDSFRRWKHRRMLMMRSQLWQVREIVRKRARKIELNKLVIQLWKHFPYRVIVNWVSSPLFAGPWSPCGHTLVCPCVCTCVQISVTCAHNVPSLESSSVSVSASVTVSVSVPLLSVGDGAGKISCSSGSLIRIKWKHAVYIVPNNFSSFGFLWHLKWLLDKGFTKRLLQNLLQLRFVSRQGRRFFVATPQKIIRNYFFRDSTKQGV